MADRQTYYSSQVLPEHLPFLEVVEGAAAELREAYRDRTQAIALAAGAGASLENIGRAAGLTRERVRQILAGHLATADSPRHAGVEGADGG